MKRKTKHCGNPQCSTSTGVCESITHGWGNLNDYGYWEYPCETCARHYEMRPNQDWPFSNEMTEAEKQKIDELYAEFLKGRQEDGGVWPEYTGPGK